MSDETTPQDSAAMPPASAGSVGGPVAWVVCTPSDGPSSPCFFNEELARVHHSNVKGVKNVVTLYRKPTLTDAERVALEQAATVADVACEEAKRWVGLPRWANGGVDDSSWQHVADSNAARAATLRGLLERMK